MEPSYGTGLGMTPLGRAASRTAGTQVTVGTVRMASAEVPSGRPASASSSARGAARRGTMYSSSRSRRWPPRLGGRPRTRAATSDPNSKGSRRTRSGRHASMISTNPGRAACASRRPKTSATMTSLASSNDRLGTGVKICPEHLGGSVGERAVLETSGVHLSGERCGRGDHDVVPRHLGTLSRTGRAGTEAARTRSGGDQYPHCQDRPTTPIRQSPAAGDGSPAAAA